MRYLRKFVQRVGLMSTLLIGGVLGGLMAPVPSEAASLSIDGVNIPLLTTIGTGAGNKYTCETGYNSCWYLTPSSTTTRTVVGITGTFTLANDTTSNRARVRINDVGGPPNTNVDKMNLTGIKLTPTTGGSKTIKIKITHTYTTGQGVGDYQWGMGATGHFDPIGTESVINNRFVLTGKGKFKTTTSSDPEVVIGKLDKGPIDNDPPVAPGQNGILTQTVNVTKVKTACNTDGNGSCKPEITYEFDVTFVGTDTLVLTDSLIGGGILCTAAQSDPLIPPILRFLMNLIDPSGNVPTHISDLYDWIDDMAVKYRLNPKQLAKVDKLKIALAKWFASTTCPGKVQTELVNDSTSGVQKGIARGGTLVPTCSDPPNTCGTGTIVIKKTTSPHTIENFGFTGTGEGISNFGIRTDDQDCSEGCFDTGTGSQTFSLLQTGAAGGSRTITETGLPSGWSTTDVSCTNSGGVNSTDWTTYYGAASSAYVTVHNLADGDTVTCTFDNSHVASTGHIQINKALPGLCNGSCEPVIFSFAITGPTNVNLDIHTDGFGQGSSGLVSVDAGSYHVEELAKPGWGPWVGGSPNCGDNLNPSVVEVVAGHPVACHFNNAPQIN